MAGLKLPTLSPAALARLEEVLGTLKGLPSRFPFTDKGDPQALLEAQRELMALQGRYPDAPTQLQLYHGSPHKFDKFDFENNMLKGEGAMAYGPGGYMTGNRDLAAHYANKLTQVFKDDRPTGPLGGSPWLNRMMSIDPDATIGYLQGKNLAAFDIPALQRGAKMSSARDRLIDPKGGRWDPDNRVYDRFISAPQHINLEAFLDHAARAGVDINDLAPHSYHMSASPTKRSQIRGEDSMYDALKVGDKLAGAPSPIVNWGASEQRPPRGHGPQLNPGEELLRDPRPANTSNLRALAAAQAGIDAGPKLKNGMGSENAVDMRGFRDKLAGWDRSVIEKPKPQPNIYHTTFDANPNNMFSYEGRLRDESPIVQGALGRVADKFGVNFNEDMTGEVLIHALSRRGGHLPVVQALKEEGVPGLYFQRAGRRSDGKLPESFNPDDHNFVIFDQDKVNIDDVKNKQHGGRV